MMFGMTKKNAGHATSQGSRHKNYKNAVIGREIAELLREIDEDPRQKEYFDRGVSYMVRKATLEWLEREFPELRKRLPMNPE